jgi:restriction endonuclease Mrr
MAIPDYQTLMLPVLEFAAGGETSVRDCIGALADKLGLTQEGSAASCSRAGSRRSPGTSRRRDEALAAWLNLGFSGDSD